MYKCHFTASTFLTWVAMVYGKKLLMLAFIHNVTNVANQTCYDAIASTHYIILQGCIWE